MTTTTLQKSILITSSLVVVVFVIPTFVNAEDDNKPGTEINEVDQEERTENRDFEEKKEKVGSSCGSVNDHLDKYIDEIRENESLDQSMKEEAIVQLENKKSMIDVLTEELNGSTTSEMAQETLLKIKAYGTEVKNLLRHWSFVFTLHRYENSVEAIKGLLARIEEGVLAMKNNDSYQTTEWDTIDQEIENIDLALQNIEIEMDTTKSYVVEKDFEAAGTTLTNTQEMIAEAIEQLRLVLASLQAVEQ